MSAKRVSEMTDDEIRELAGAQPLAKRIAELPVTDQLILLAMLCGSAPDAVEASLGRLLNSEGAALRQIEISRRLV